MKNLSELNPVYKFMQGKEIISSTPLASIIFNMTGSGTQFTAEEVSKHSSPESLWIIIDGAVYDVTEWQKKHPGGKKMLQKVGGKDASKQFHKYHDVGVVLKKYGDKFKIGTLAKSDVNMNQSAAMAITPQDVPFGDPAWAQGYSSPFYTKSHALFRDRLREYVNANLMPYVDEWDQAGKIPEEVYQNFGKAGYLAYACPAYEFPSSYIDNKHADIVPTKSFDKFHQNIIVEELCRPASCGLLWFLIEGLAIGLPPVINHGSPELRRSIVPAVLSGKKRICLAITEPRGGSDVANLETTAERQGDFYIVNGIKKFITNGLWADYFSVAVRTGGKGGQGVSMLLIERNTPGVSTSAIKVQGVKGSGTAFVEFDDVKVPVSNLLGKENQGFKVIMSNFNHERLGFVTQAQRFSRVCLEEALKYSQQRETFGQPLIGHPVIRNKLAQMASRIEAVSAWQDSLTYQVQTMRGSDALLGGPVGGAKAYATQVFEYCAREASQILGGISYQVGGRGAKVERLYRDVRALAIPGGSEEILLDLMIRQSVRSFEKIQANL